MRSLGLIFKFELKETLRKKSLIISTLILAVIALVVTSIPSFIVLFDKPGTTDEVPPGNQEFVEDERIDFDAGFVFIMDEDLKVIESVVKVETVFDSEESLTKAIESEEVAAGFVVESLTQFKYITKDQSVFASDSEIFSGLLRDIAVQNQFAQEGIDYNKVNEILATEIKVESITLGKDASLGMPIAFAIMFLLYMVILMYGNGVSTSVAREKDSRTMELLITSTGTKELILGKVAAAGVAGVLQMGIILGATFLGFFISKSNYPPELLMMIQGEMSLNVIIVYILFSVLGYILYLFIFAALGSLVSKVEDVAGVVTPITMIFVVAYFIASLAMQMPDSKLTIISSYIPFVSMFTMPIRYMLTTVNSVELLISFGIMVLSTYLLAVLSMMIYRYGSLNYGNKLKLSKVVKDLIRSKGA